MYKMKNPSGIFPSYLGDPKNVQPPTTPPGVRHSVGSMTVFCTSYQMIVDDKNSLKKIKMISLRPFSFTVSVLG